MTKYLMLWNNTSDFYEGTTSDFKFKNKIAVFDLDGTLMCPANKKDKISTGYFEWEFQFPNVIDIIQKFYNSDNNYCIVIISNQMLIGSGKVNGDEWCKKIENFAIKIGINFKIYCAIQKNIYRKPSPKFVIDFFPKNFHSDSFFCGDACGRKGDFSDSDLKFAYNAQLKFYTPEHIFCGFDNAYPIIQYPVDFQILKKISHLDKFDFVPIGNNIKELVIMVGFPGSGKSTIANDIKLKYNYELVNQDTEKTAKKCINLVEKHLSLGKNIIVDNTNPGISQRKIWIDIAKKYNYKISVINMNSDRDLSMHNNYYRAIFTGAKIIPTIVYNIYNKNYEKPSLDENIDRILFANISVLSNSDYYKFFF